MSTVEREMTPAEWALELRKKIQGLANEVNIMRAKLQEPSWADVNTAFQSEMIANATLSYRHLEDASMRLGKVIQCTTGGVSVYAPEAVTIG